MLQRIRTPFQLALAVSALALAVTVPLAALPKQCYETCDPTKPCSTICWEGSTQTTCGDSGSACQTNCPSTFEKTEIGRHQSGPVPLWCKYWVSYQWTERNCNGQVISTWCQDVQDGFGVNINCCYAWGCWGQHC